MEPNYLGLMSKEVYDILVAKAKSIGVSLFQYINGSKHRFVVFSKNDWKAWEHLEVPGDWAVWTDHQEAVDFAKGLGKTEVVITEYEYLSEHLGLDVDLSDELQYLVESGSYYPIYLKMSGADVKACYHSGECSGDVRNYIDTHKEQFDAISDEELDKWWGEMFIDDTPEEHANATKETKLSWLVFDACACAIDGEWEIAE
jgi:hypothetical protein